jgi:uncharacterized damage-inducible protein DinB
MILSMDHLLADLLAHQAWADAESWRALRAHPTALEDSRLWERQHHILLVQRAFLAVARGEEVQLTKPGDFTPQTLRESARAVHAEFAALLGTLEEERLAAPLDVPWFRDQPGTITLREGLIQATLHSLGHRAQNAARLRELGGVPAAVDFILWLAQGRPAPAWD